jgi:hypothetical protein
MAMESRERAAAEGSTFIPAEPSFMLSHQSVNEVGKYYNIWD